VLFYSLIPSRDSFIISLTHVINVVCHSPSYHYSSGLSHFDTSLEFVSSNTHRRSADRVRLGSHGRTASCCYSRRWQAEQMESPSLPPARPPATIGLIKLEQYNSVLAIAELWSHFILQMEPQHFLFMKYKRLIRHGTKLSNDERSGK
jgi:hypothetical protein